MQATIATLTLALLGLACQLHIAHANANGLTNYMCETFSVLHTRDPQEDLSKDVRIELIQEDGNITDCFWPQQDYYGKRPQW